MAANYTLRITYPLAIGASGTGLDSNNRCYRAYTGVQYSIRVAVHGGVFPFTFSLSNAPSGMIIDSRGVITWASPTAGTYSDIVVTVQDSDSPADTDTATFTLTVGTAGFFFVDAVAGHASAVNGGSPAGTGAIDNPWLTLDDVYDGSTANSITYFKSGTYLRAGVPTSGTGRSERSTFNSATRSVIWLAYPGESPVLNFGNEDGTTVVPFVELDGENQYIDGFEVKFGCNHFFRMSHQASYRGSHFHNCHFHHMGPGIGGDNSGPLMVQRTDDSGPPAVANPVYFFVCQDCEFSSIDYGTGNCCLKLYDLIHPVLEDLEIHDTTTGDGQEGMIALKDMMEEFCVRNCTGYNIDGTFIGGNHHMTVAGHATRGEITFCNCKDAGTAALEINNDGQALEFFIERCTLQGIINIRNTDASDGIFTFRNTVIVNAQGGNTINWVTTTGTVDASRVSLVGSLTPSGTQNLAGAAADNIVDANGLLLGSYRSSFLGSWGHELLGVQQVGRTRHRGFRLRAA